MCKQRASDEIAGRHSCEGIKQAGYTRASVCLWVCLWVESVFHLYIFWMFALYVVVRPSVVCLSVTFMHPTQPVEIFGNVSTPFATMATDIQVKFYEDRPRGTLMSGE